MSSTTMSAPQTTSGSSADIVRQVGVIAALVSTLVINGLAEAVPFNAQTSAQISNRLPVLFTPANFAFSIWGVIYTMLFVFAVYQGLPSQRTNPMMRKIAPWFVLSCICNAAWLVLFHYNLFLLSCFVIVGLLVSLIAIYQILGIGRRAVSNVERWCTHVPFSIYLGWLCVATIANISYTLYEAGYRGQPIGEQAWAVIMMVIAGGLATFFAYARHEIALVGVFVWALAAIGAKQGSGTVVGSAAFMIAIILVLVVIGCQFLESRRNRPIVTGRRPIAS